MSALHVFIDWPWLALLPAACFFTLAYVCRRAVIWGAGYMWVAFGAYNWLVARGFLCLADCESRPELLVVYPALGVVTAVAMLSSLQGRKEVELP